MAKVKTTYYCQNCGAQHSKWQGQCTSCREWSTLVEEVIQKAEPKDWKTSTKEVKRAPKPLRVSEI